MRTIALTEVRDIGEAPGISDLTNLKMRTNWAREISLTARQTLENDEFVYGD